MMNSDAYSGICVWLFETGSTRCSECDSHYNEQARVNNVESTRYSEGASCRSEKARNVNIKVSFGFYALFG